VAYKYVWKSVTGARSLLVPVKNEGGLEKSLQICGAGRTSAKSRPFVEEMKPKGKFQLKSESFAANKSYG
jgi:hypothetical protein